MTDFELAYRIAWIKYVRKNFAKHFMCQTWVNQYRWVLMLNLCETGMSPQNARKLIKNTLKRR